MIDKQTTKFVARIAENLPTDMSSEVMQEWIDNPGSIKKILKRFSSSVYSPSSHKVRDTWKTIALGMGRRNVIEFCSFLKDSGYYVSDMAKIILGSPCTTMGKIEGGVDLVACTVSELGRENGARVDAVYAIAESSGLKPVPAEVGLQLRLQYPNQPKGERLLIGMDPSLYLARESVLVIGHDKRGLYIDGHYAVYPFVRVSPILPQSHSWQF